MSVVEAAILGVIQGITEWLPISSSGHLVLYQQIAEVDVPFLFDVLLHFASLVVILVVFRQRIGEILKSSEYIRNVILGSIPIALAGYFARDVIEASFSNMRVVPIALIVTGFFLFLTRFSNDIKHGVPNSQHYSSVTPKHDIKKNAAKISPLKSITVGIAQSLALIPGLSRSGVTISTGMLLGIDRKKSAEFSFILAIPAILGATLFETFRVEYVDKTMVVPMLTGMIISFIVGCFSLRFLLKVIQRGRFHWFSVYCIALGVVLCKVL